jgi:hypothetical protein
MQIYERTEFFVKSRVDRLYHFNAIRRMSDGKFHLEREGYVLDMLSTKGESDDDVFFTDIQEAILEFLKGTGLSDKFVSE